MLNSYRFGFNGKEQDNEVSGKGNSYDYGLRMYNPRLGKFNSVDPLTGKFPMLTPYQFASNTPIMADDLDGAEARVVIKTINYFSGIMFDKDGNSHSVTLRQVTTTTSHPGGEGFKQYGNQRKYGKYGTLNVEINEREGAQVGKTHIYAPTLQTMFADYIKEKAKEVKEAIQPIVHQIRTGGEYQQEADGISVEATSKALKGCGTVCNYAAIPATLLGPEATAGCLEAGKYFNWAGTGLEAGNDAVNGNVKAAAYNVIGTGVSDVVGGAAGKTTENLVGGSGTLSTGAEVLTGEALGKKTDEVVDNARKKKH